ncbi:acetyl-CoA synthetase [Pelagirhabdus alkalitolerans]|uniref:acetate--CoA ligase n=1 Tax=Pelagirhabdus alkalitolerans TaxID=1612202 RepID=A0A1G6LBH5_9BACI|nr:acetate--CoA ligase [Pelagirhabdus alkalitolerans]SDC40792.1 acetyl-CoA synthetase [Pelagirhabdus alkalitolerans]
MGEILKPLKGDFHLTDYQSVYETFNWKDVSLFNKQTVNAAYETIDRHVEEGYGEKIALHYVNQDKREDLTFKEVQRQVNHYVHILRSNGVKKGDRVFIFLPKNPACYIAILATIRIGAIAGPLFEGFMEEAIKERINDCKANVLITDQTLGERIKTENIPTVATILYQETIEKAPIVEDHYVEWMDPGEGMLIHYTSGSTGQPKGVLHAHRAVTHHAQSGKWVLDVHDEDVYWCTSHPGWVTGSVYGLFAPWLNRATIVIQGGRFNAKLWYQIIEDLGVSILYSAPTAFRYLMAEGDLYKQYDLSSLRHILSVGEPLNPEVIYWAHRALQLRIHDTWWMTETGGHIIVNLPSEPIKPGSMGRPFPGIEVGILDEEGNELPRGEIGQLAVKTTWPGLMKTIWNNDEKFRSYFPYKGWYISGDLATQDEDGYIFFQGRHDDMINSSGERIGPFEVESSLIEHPAVKEAGVIGKPDEIRGEIVKAFITLRSNVDETPELKESIRQHVKTRLAAHSAPREIEVINELPKTKISGKILRRELKQKEIERQAIDKS